MSTTTGFLEYLAEIAKTTYKDLSDDTLKSYRSKYSNSSDPTERTKLNAVNAELKRRGHGSNNSSTSKEIGKSINKSLTKGYRYKGATARISGDSETKHIGDFTDTQKNTFSKHLKAAVSDKTSAGAIIKKDGKVVAHVNHDDNGIDGNTRNKFSVKHVDGENGEATDRKWERKYPFKRGNHEQELRTYKRDDLSADEALASITSKHGEGKYSVHSIHSKKEDDELRSKRKASKDKDSSITSTNRKAAEKFVDKKLGTSSAKTKEEHDSNLDKHYDDYKAGKISHTKFQDEVSKHREGTRSAEIDDADRKRIVNSLAGDRYEKRHGLNAFKHKQKI